MKNFFFHSLSFAVRGYEIDSFHHVNNAVYLQWLELARWDLMKRKEFEQASTEIMPILRHVSLDFRQEIIYGETICVGLWGRQVGTTSMTIGAAIYILDSSVPNKRQSLACVAQQIIVCTNLNKEKTKVPASWRSFFPQEDPGTEPPAQPPST